MSTRAFVKAAIIAALQADAAVSALVGKKIYDEVPRDNRGLPTDAQAPYIYMGPISRKADNSQGCFRGWIVSARVQCVSRQPGRDEAGSIADAADKALNEKPDDTSASYNVQNWRVLGDGDIIRSFAPKEVFLDVQCELFDLTRPLGPM